jgi:hypothetical protein
MASGRIREFLEDAENVKILQALSLDCASGLISYPPNSAWS